VIYFCITQITESMDFFLETDRLGFRCWSINDKANLKTLWSNPMITQMLLSSGPLNDEQIDVLLHAEIDSLKRHGIQHWPFFSKETGEIIGACGLKPYKLFDGIFELGIYILPNLWNKGYGYEACSAMIQYTIHTLNIKSIFAGHNPQYISSANLLKKLGFKYTHVEYYPPSNMNHASYILEAEMLVDE